MSDDDAADEETSPGRPDHPARRPAGEPTPDEADERYLTGEDGSEDAGSEDADAGPVDSRGVFTRILDRVPAWVADLGAGFLLASTLISLILTAFAAYSLATGWYVSLDLPPSRVVTMVVVFGLSTLFQAVAVRWARQRVKWMWVMLATAMGMLSIVGSPFALPAAVCLFISKRHFAVATPIGLMGDESEEGDEAGDAGEGSEADAT